MLTFKTATGSVYEVDPAGRRARRVSASASSGASARVTGDWRSFDDFRAVTGEPAVFVWGDDTPPLDPATSPALKTTVTSVVTSLEVAE